MEKKNWIKILGSVFIALILVVSYAAYGSSNSTSSTTVTAAVNQGSAYWHGVNTTRVPIKSFGSVFTVNLDCQNQTVDSAVENYTYSQISKLYNQSIDVTELGSSIYVNSGNWTSKRVYGYVEGRLNASAAKCTLFDLNAHITLPSQVRFKLTYLFASSTPQTESVTIPSAYRNYTIPMVFANNLTNSTNITITSLLTQNLGIYGNLTVSVA